MDSILQICGLTSKKTKIFIFLAVFWVGLQVFFVSAMLSWGLSNIFSDYALTCLRDLERIRVASLSILQSLLMFCAFVNLLFMISKKHRPSAIKNFVIVMILICNVVLGTAVSNWTIKGRLNQIVENAAPLITALRTYEVENGHPPETLEELVPKYIAVIPHPATGLAGEYNYMVDKTKWWCLRVPAFSYNPKANYWLAYCSNENYATHDPKARPPERIKDWAIIEF